MHRSRQPLPVWCQDKCSKYLYLPSVHPTHTLQWAYGSPPPRTRTHTPPFLQILPSVMLNTRKHITTSLIHFTAHPNIMHLSPTIICRSQWIIIHSFSPITPPLASFAASRSVSPSGERSALTRRLTGLSERQRGQGGGGGRKRWNDGAQSALGRLNLLTSGAQFQVIFIEISCHPGTSTQWENGFCFASCFDWSTVLQSQSRDGQRDRRSLGPDKQLFR